MNSTMTSRERLVAALSGKPVDRVPFSPFLAYVWGYFPSKIQQAGELAFLQEIGADPLWRGSTCPVRVIQADTQRRQFTEGGRQYEETITPVGTLRQASVISDAGNTQFLVEHPLKTEEDYKVAIWIEEHSRNELDPAAMAEIVKSDISYDGLCLGMLVPRWKSAFQSLTEHWAGTEALQYALADFPDTVETLWQVMVQNDMDAVRLAMEAPYEYYLTFEDSSTQNYSPTQYDTYIGSEIGQWCDLLRSSGKKYIQHACGHTKELVSRMKSHGVSVVESMSPPPTGNLPLRDCRRIAGDNFGIIGGIEPLTFLNMAEDQLPSYVEQVLADGTGGPFVLANSDSCPPGVTPEKFKIVADVARRWTP